MVAWRKRRPNTSWRSTSKKRSTLRCWPRWLAAPTRISGLMSPVDRCCRKRSSFCRWVPWIALLGETWSRFRLWRSLDRSLVSHAAGANWGVTGGPMERSAKVLRFCTIAARWNSSRAPDSPRSRMRRQRLVARRTVQSRRRPSEHLSPGR
jgi:hypothetical protein